MNGSNFSLIENMINSNKERTNILALFYKPIKYIWDS